jgi:hypothetical protein
MAFEDSETSIITLECILSLVMFIEVGLGASVSGVSITVAAAAGRLGFATVIMSIVITAAIGISRMLAGAAGGSGSICHGVHWMLGKFTKCISASHVHVIHSLSPLTTLCNSICCYQT